MVLPRSGSSFEQPVNAVTAAAPVAMSARLRVVAVRPTPVSLRPVIIAAGERTCESGTGGRQHPSEPDTL